ncbi:MAG TPA: methyl-accepting chemotaxis protein [Beijerinckiaceae bacterium]|nr:methyl-accepting chemotaxis protein [Beijerinckiaceae bacterium]
MKFDRPVDLASRLATYGLDEAARGKLRALAREIAPALEPGTREGLQALSGSSSAAAAISKHERRIFEVELEHFEVLLGGEIGAAYLQSCLDLLQKYEEFGLTPRTHIAVSNYVFNAAVTDLARKRRFNGLRLAEATRVLNCAFSFDLATVFAIYQDGSTQELVARKQAVDGAISAFEPIIAEVSESILNAAKSLDEGSATLKESALRTVDVVRSASQIAVESTQGMASSAQATEELHLSINEIARAVGMGSESAKHAVKNAEDAKFTLDDLVKIAAQVGSVVTAISGIAQQTNLLALNATIEAAHAGAAGRGFAVVASEVKALSARTAEATREITQQIQAMQESTLASAERMSNVIDAVTQAASTTNSIAVAIDQQRAVTKSIAETVARVAEVANRSSADLAAVSESASRGLVTSEEIVAWSSRLAGSAQSLQTNVADLYQRVRFA